MTPASLIQRGRVLLGSPRLLLCAAVALLPALVGLTFRSWAFAIFAAVSSGALLLITALLTQHSRRIFTAGLHQAARLDELVTQVEARYEEIERRLEARDEAFEGRLDIRFEHVDRRLDEQISSALAAHKAGDDRHKALSDQVQELLSEVSPQLADHWILMHRIREDTTAAAELADARHLQMEQRNYSHLDELFVPYSEALDGLRGRLSMLQKKYDDMIQRSAQIAGELMEVRYISNGAELNEQRYAAVADALIEMSRKIDELTEKLALQAPSRESGLRAVRQ